MVVRVVKCFFGVLQRKDDDLLHHSEVSALTFSRILWHLAMDNLYLLQGGTGQKELWGRNESIGSNRIMYKLVHAI